MEFRGYLALAGVWVSVAVCVKKKKMAAGKKSFFRGLPISLGTSILRPQSAPVLTQYRTSPHHNTLRDCDYGYIEWE